MHLFNIEHSKSAYRADFVLYGVASVALAISLVIAGPRELRVEGLVLALLGMAGWTLIEYVLHRFVLHGVRPFSVWHAEHHRAPTALICTPTILSATLIAALVFLPALLLSDLWRASALTFGLLTGYLIYAVTHHALHHWPARTGWLSRRKQWHGLHHASGLNQRSHYGVTSGFWDIVFGTRHPKRQPRRPRQVATTQLDLFDDAPAGASQTTPPIAHHG